MLECSVVPGFKRSQKGVYVRGGLGNAQKRPKTPKMHRILKTSKTPKKSIFFFVRDARRGFFEGAARRGSAAAAAAAAAAATAVAEKTFILRIVGPPFGQTPF